MLTARLLCRALIATLAIPIAAGTSGAQSLPAGWASQDIGAVGLAGSATHGGGTFTLQGAGADIWGAADSFHFANQLLSGDGEIVARVASMDNTNTYAKAGVMIRESLTAGSRHVVLDLKPGGGVEFMARGATGGTTSFIAGGTGRWLKLARSNGVFTASVSADGAAWTVIGSRAVTMGTNAWVGLAVCSHNTGVLNKAVFDNVTVEATGGADPPPTASITSPAAGATFAAGSSVGIAANATASGATPVAAVGFYANDGTTNTLLGTDTTSPYTFTWTNVPAGSYSLTAVATDTADRTGTSSGVAITVVPPGGGLPVGWAGQDIGSVGRAGTATYSNGTFTIQGAGADVWGTADSFFFANQLLPGDGQIVARVASMENTHTYAKAGVMIRETLTPGSRHVLLDMKPNGGVEFLARTATGGTTSFVAGATARWLKLARSNGVFTASVSADGRAWTAIGSRAVTMAGNVWVGLAVCSHNTSLLNTALFDSVTVTAGQGGGGDQPPTVSITSPSNGSGFTAGATITVNADATGGDPTPVARVDFYANGLSIGTDTTSPYSVNWTNVAAGSYSLTAVATDTANQATTSSAVGITVLGGGGSGSLPAGWANRDIGVVGIPGSASYSNGTFTVNGAGADIWGAADGFHFASRTLTGTGEIAAVVASMSNTHTYAKAGVMIRGSSSANSPHVTLVMKPDGTVEFLARAVQGGPTSYLGGATGHWVRLVRTASNAFAAYVSMNGGSWLQLGSAIVTMPATVEMGLVVCSHSVSALNTAVFQTVSAISSPSSRPAPVITGPPGGTTFLVGSAPVVTATASENVPIDFYVDDGTTNRFMGSFNDLGANRPPTFMWFGPQAGTYSLRAVAQYPDGWVTSNPVTVHVSSTPAGDVPPTVRITSALTNLVAGTPVTLTAAATDPDATPVVRVDYWLEEWFYDYSLRHTYIGGGTVGPYAVNWTPSSGLVANIIAIATDSAGLASAASVWVQVPIAR